MGASDYFRVGMNAWFEETDQRRSNGEVGEIPGPDYTLLCFLKLVRHAPYVQVHTFVPPDEQVDYLLEVYTRPGDDGPEPWTALLARRIQVEPDDAFAFFEARGGARDVIRDLLTTRIVDLGQTHKTDRSALPGGFVMPKHLFLEEDMFSDEVQTRFNQLGTAATHRGMRQTARRSKYL